MLYVEEFMSTLFQMQKNIWAEEQKERKQCTTTFADVERANKHADSAYDLHKQSDCVVRRIDKSGDK